jgi:hypothetical protein
MPQPKTGDVHINAPLTNISLAYLQNLGGFIADKVFPNVPVKKKSDSYFTYPKQQWFRSDAKQRAPSTESAGSGYEVSSDDYSCKRYALHKDVDDEIRANTDSPLDADRDATEFVMRDLTLKKELLWKAKYFTTGIWTGSSTGGDITPSTKWDASGATMFKEIRAEKKAMHTKTGFMPNKLVLAADVWNKIQDGAEMLDRIKITQDKIATVELMKAVLDLEEVLIADAVYDSANEGATASMTDVFNADALLVYAAPRPAILTPSAGYTFNWTGYIGAAAKGQRIKKFRMEALDSDRIEGEMYFDQKIVASDLGVFFNNVLT